MRILTIRFSRAGMAVLLLSLLSSGCAFVSLKNWFEQSGTVLYKDIEKPVPNAMIAAVWRGENAEQEGNPTICYHVKTAKTGNDGYFLIPGWREYFKFSHLREKDVFIIVYKPGFWSETILQSAPTVSKNTYYIEPVSDDNRQTSTKNRLKYLQKLVGLTGCNVESADRSKLMPLYDSILAEAKKIAETPMEKKIVESLTTWTQFVSPEQKAKQAKKK